MRPIKLSITAFGPFINTEVIDFEALGDNPLFLINGTTGSGKTTILDAICFALYGQTTGNEREAMQMRCDFAPDDLLTKVEFIFELADKHYRILRIPEQTRNKSVGEGTTKQVASAELTCLDSEDGSDDVLLVARKVSDANRKIEELTGLQVDQFRQVMVLPQGQFRKLLMASSRDREEIFSQLFETHVYKRIEDKLRAQAKKVYKKVEELKEHQQGILQSVDFENVTELDEAIEKFKPEVESIKASLALKETIYQEGVKKFENAKELSQSFTNLKQQEEKIETLKLKEKEFDEKKKQLHLSEIAQKITPDFNILSKVSDSYEEASKQLNTVEKQFNSAVKNLENADLELSKNPQRLLELDELKKEQITLQSYQTKGKALQQELENLQSIQEKFLEGELQSKKAQSTLDESVKNQEKAENERQSLESELNKGVDLKLNSQTLYDQIDKRRNYDALQSKISNLSKEIEEITTRGKSLKSYFDQKEKYSKELEFKWHKAQAAILAKELKEDQACPVCGSLEHPMPAQSEQDYPTEEEREQAQQAVTIAREEYLKAREGYSNLTTHLKALNDQLADLQKQWNDVSSVSLVDLDKEQEQLVLQLNQYEAQQKQSKILLESIEKLKLEQLNSRTNLGKIQAQQSELNAKRQASIALVESAKKALPEEYRELSKLKQASLKVSESIENLGKIITLTQERKTIVSNAKTEAETNLKNQQSVMEKLKIELETAQSSWQLALSNSDFNDEEVYKKAHCDEEIRSSLKASIDRYNEECQQIIGAIKHQTSLLKDKSKPDIVLLETQLEKVRVEKQSLDEKIKEIGAELSRLEKARITISNISKNQQAEEDEYKVIGTLSSVANGLTGNKISLQRFVLSVLLDDVLIDASHRLKIMSKGRYLLLRKEDRSKGNKASGLELEVEDSYTGKVRPVSTLSGGESFMASLSLALGLSDVVQAYAGGIHLDTLFIDEGFGSLDADSLDLAIRTLMDLRDTGRMVGIISHVSELKEQIPLRLDVKTGDHGSHIELVN